MGSNTGVRIAVVGGSGLIGKRHCQHVANNPRAHLIAIVDPSPAAQSIAKSHATSLYPNVAELLASNDKPDAAIVCTPNQTHVPVSLELIRAGVHVLCEKPISDTVQTAVQLVREAKARNVQLLIGHHRRFNPYMIAMKQAVSSGVLGEITGVSGLWASIKPASYFAGDQAAWRSSHRRGGGTILINFIHEIDLLQYLLGPVLRVHAEKTISRRTPSGPSDSVEEGAALTLRFESGVVGSFFISDNVATPHTFEQGTGENPLLPWSGQDVYRLFGTKGTLSFPDMMLSNYEHGVEPSWELPIQMQKLDVPNRNVAPLDSQLDHFIDVCLGEASPSCTGEDALRALVVCESIRTALSSPDGSGTVQVSPLN